MANLPEVGLNAVIDNLANFQKGADSIAKAYDEINAGADSVESTTGLATGAISGLGGVAATVATGGMALLATAVAAVAAAAAAAVAGIGLLAKASFDLASEVEASQKKIQSQLGVTEEEAIKLGETARDVWANNFAGSVTEAAEALVTVKQQLKGISDEELQDATENAIRLADAFGVDVVESTNAANVLMKDFGLTQQQAFDFITEGFQRGLNSSDDFLDSVSEYGSLFGQAGGDAGQFFSLLETGLQGGVLGTDKAADAFKEFSIRIVDGSEKTEDALNDLFLEVDGVGGEIAELERDYESTTKAVEANAKALEESEGAYDATKQVVDELEKALGDARRELDDLSRPNLAGMQEFDDTLFNLEQQSNQVQLAMLNMTPDSEQFEAAQEQLDNINKEMDRVALERDIQFEPQLRAIEKATQDGTEPLKTFDQVMAAIGEKKSEIAGLEGAFNSANGELKQNEAAVNAARKEQERLVEQVAFLETAMENASSPAQEFLNGFVDGSLNGVDAFTKVIDKLGEVEDPLLRDQLAIELFGTQFEDLGVDAGLAIDLAKTSLEELGGATDTLNAQYNTLPQAFEGVKRQLLVAIQPIGDALLETANTVMPLLLDAIEDMKPALEDFAVLLGDFITKAIQDLIPWIQKKLIPALKDMWKFIKKNVLPIIEDLWDLFGESKKQSKTVQKSFEKMMDVIEPFIKKTMANLLEIWEIMKKWVDKNWPLIQKTIAVVMFKIKSSIDKTTKAIQKIWDKWGDEIMAVVTFVFDTVFKIVKTGIEDVLDIITAVMQIITGDWDDAWETILGILERHTKAMNDIIKDAFELVKTIISDKMVDIKDTINTKWEEIKTSVVTKVNEMIQGIKDAIRNAAGIGQALIDKIKEALNELSSAITGGSIFQKLSEIGGKIASGIISGFTAVKDFVANMAGKLGEWLSSLVSLVGNAGSFIGKIISNIGTKIVSTIINGISNFVGFIELVRTKIAGWVTGIVTQLGSIATSAKALGMKIITNIQNGISSMATSFKIWLKKKFEEWLNGIFSNNASFSLSGTSNFSTPSQVSGPALGATSSVTTTNNFNIGGNNIASNMDAAVFEARVLQVIRQNL